MKHKVICFQCLQCGPNFSTAASLYFHMKTVHEGQIVQCNMCYYRMATKRSLKVPLRSKYEKLDAKCVSPNLFVEVQ